MKKISILVVFAYSFLIGLHSLSAASVSLSQAKQYTDSEQKIKQTALKNIIDSLLTLETQKFKNRFDQLATMAVQVPTIPTIDALDKTDAQNLIDSIDKLKADNTFDPSAPAPIPAAPTSSTTTNADTLWTGYLKPATAAAKSVSLSTTSKNIWNSIKTAVTSIETTGFSKPAGAQWEDSTLRFLDQVKAIIRLFNPSVQQQTTSSK